MYYHVVLLVLGSSGASNSFRCVGFFDKTGPKSATVNDKTSGDELEGCKGVYVAQDKIKAPFSLLAASHNGQSWDLFGPGDPSPG